MLKKLSNGRSSLQLSVLGMAAASALLPYRTGAAVDVWTSTASGTTYPSTTANNIWLNPVNWASGLPGAGDVAQFTNASGGVSTLPNSNKVVWDFADGGISTGAITDIIPATISSPNLTFSNSSAGTLFLNGATVTVPVPAGTQTTGSTSETFPNTILSSTDSSTSNKNLTLNTNIGLSGSTNNILNYVGVGGESKNNSGFPTITLNGNIVNATGTASGVTFLGGGSPTLEGGELYLGGTNTFTGGLTIGNAANGSGAQTNLQSGEVYLSGPSALPTTGTITVNEQSQLAFTGASGSNFSTGSQTLILNGIGMGKNISGALRPSGGVAGNPINWLGNIQLGTSAVAYDGDNGAVLITVASAGSYFRLAGNMSGGDFIEQGGGVFELGGSNNTYRNTQLGNGGILVDSNSSLGTGDVELFQTSSNNPTLTLANASQTIGSLISAFTATSATSGLVNNANGYIQNISLNGTTLTITEPANSTFGYGNYNTLTSGINDFGGGSPGSVVYNSTTGHTLTLTAQNSYSGGTVIKAGTVNIANNFPGVSVGSAFGSGPVQINSGGILASGNYALAAGFSTGSAATTVTGGTFTGQLNVSGGATVIPGGGNVGFLNTGPITASANSTFDFTIASATVGNYSTITSTGAVSFDTSGTETFNVTGSKLATGTFDLVTGSSVSSNTSGGGVVLGTTPAGPNRVYTLSESGTQVILTVVNTGVERDWSVGGNSPATDGSGTWQSGSTNFFTLSNGVVASQVPYNNAATADTAFGNGGSGGTITLGSNVTVGGTFILGSLSSGSYTFVSSGTNSLTINGGVSASNSTLISSPVVLGASQTWSVDSGVVLSVAGNIGQSSASQLTKSGNGTLLLTGTGSWTGGTVISQGTLQTTTAAVPAAGGIVNSATLNFDQTTSGTYAGLISGSGSVIISNVAGTGTPSVALSNAGNTYTGSTTLAGGTVVVANVGDLGTGDGGIILGGGTLQATGNLLFPLNAGSGSTLKRTLTLTNGTTSTIDTQGNTVEFDSNIGGSGSLVKVGSGTLVLEGIPSTTSIGSLISEAGTIQIAQQLAGASFIFSGSTTPGLETGKIEITGPTLTRLGGGDFSGGGSFQVDLTGIQLIGYGGSNTTVGNTISLNPQNLTGGFVTFIGSDTTSQLALNGPIIGNADVDFTGGKGFLTLGGTSTYTGSTKIDNSTGGSVQLTVNNPLPTATDVTVTSSGNLDLNGFNLAIGSLTSSSAAAVVQNTSQTNNSVLTITGPASTTFNGILQDATFAPTLGLTLNSGTGALALPNGEAYAGPVTILSGRLDLTGISDGTGTTAINTTGLGATSAITIGDSTAPNSMDAQLRFTGIVGTVSYSTDNHPGTAAPVITLEALGGFNTGGGTVTSGAIRVSSASAVVLTDPIVFANSSVISATDTSTLTLAGQLSGPGTFISQGTGTITLTADNTGYTGGTEIDAGTVNVSSGSSLGTGPLAVNNTLNTGNGSTGLPVILNLNNTAQSVGSLSGTIIAPATGTNTATINLAVGTTLTINQTVAGTYAGAVNGSGGSLVKNGSASLVLAGGVTYTGTTNVSAGSLTFGANQGVGIQQITSAGVSVGNGAKLILGNSATHSNRTLLTTAALNITQTAGAWTGTVDVGSNDLDIQNAGFIGLVQTTGQIASAFKSGKWTGTGITSSVAGNDTTHLTALGVILNNVGGNVLYGAGAPAGPFDGTSPSSTDVLVKYTYFGDTDLNGKVDASDYSRIDNGFLTHATGWANGDFNYDNVINGSDYTLIDNAFNLQGGQITTNTSELAETSSQINNFATSAVPEPASMLSLGMLAVGQLGRRRRRVHV